MAENTEDIRIDLNRSLDRSSLPKNDAATGAELLQRRARDKVRHLLREIHSKSSDYDPKNTTGGDEEIERFNNTVFIHGERGAGKTTFLRYLLNTLENRDLWKTETGDPAPTIKAITIIDPTRIETHQHILVDIVGKFVSLVQKQMGCRCESQAEYESFRERLEAMAQGLKLLSSGNTSEHQSADAAWFLDLALEESKSGRGLECKIHRLIDSMLKIMSVDLFIIAIDDVDTDTAKAFEVLEVIRCYLTHPKLVILISGDIYLYSHIVHVKKYEEISGGENIKCLQESNDRLAQELEGQYLAKIFPLNQRINLEKLDSMRNIVIPEHSANQQSAKIEETSKTIFSEALNIKTQHLNSHIDFLLTQPVRTVLQVLKALLDAKGMKNSDVSLIQTLRQVTINGFVGAIVSEGIKTENISQYHPHINSVALELFKLLHNQGDLETGFYCRPDSSYNLAGYNAAKLYISSVITRFFDSHENVNHASGQGLSEALRIMITCGASASIYSTHVVQSLKSGATYKDYLNYIGLNRNERISSIAAHYSPIIIDGMEQQGSKVYKAVSAGIIRLPRRGNYNNFDRFLKQIQCEKKSRIKTVDDLSKQAPEKLYDKISTIAVLISSHRAKASTESRDYVSAYGLMAAIAELADSTQELSLSSLKDIKTYSYPTFLSGSTRGDEDQPEEDELEEDVEEVKDENEIDKLIGHWKSILPTIKASSLLLGKIWTRIFYSMNSISEGAKEKVFYSTEENSDFHNIKSDITLGMHFARIVWGIINAALIEEWRYGIDCAEIEKEFERTPLTNAKNTNKSPEELIKNIKSLAQDDKPIKWSTHLPLTWSLISCPLLWPFLGSYTDGKGEIQKNLFEAVKKVISTGEDKTLISDFQSIAEQSLPATLSISALPIMGFFKDLPPGIISK